MRTPTKRAQDYARAEAFAEAVAIMEKVDTWDEFRAALGVLNGRRNEAANPPELEFRP